MTQKSKSSKVVTLILMILAMNTIYMLPYLMYTYYTPLQEAMGLIGRDADYGRLLNVYGIANVILYLPGGWVADKFDCKKLLIFSMVSTGVLGLWEATFPSYTILLLIHVLFAVTTVLTFWSSSVKCVNMLADDGEQGGMFGSLEAGRGVSGLVLTVIFTSIYAANAADSTKAMRINVLLISIVMIVIGVLLAFLMPKPKNTEAATNDTLLDSIKAMGVAFKLSNHISVSRYDLLWIYVSCIYNLFCTILTEHLWITGKNRCFIFKLQQDRYTVNRCICSWYFSN